MTNERASDRFWTWSNVISLLRLVLTVPIVIVLLDNDRWMAFFLCWFAAFTDWADGFVARRTGTVSEWGKIVDPIADKVLVGAIVIVLLYQKALPPWFVVTVIVRDVVIVAASAWLRRRTPIIPPSLWSGKWAVSAIAATGVTAMVGWTDVRNVCMIAACGLMAVSLYHYTRRFNGILRQTQTENR